MKVSAFSILLPCCLYFDVYATRCDDYIESKAPCEELDRVKELKQEIHHLQEQEKHIGNRECSLKAAKYDCELEKLESSRGVTNCAVWDADQGRLKVTKEIGCGVGNIVSSYWVLIFCVVAKVFC
ncbi:Uncharacterised protein g9233 [Pycnogonum litorale]